MSDESLFRFFLVRPGRNAQQDGALVTRIPVYPPDTTTPFAQTIADRQAAGASRAEIRKLADGFRAGSGYVRRLDGEAFDIARALPWLASNGRKRLDDFHVATQLTTLYGQSPPDVVSQPAFKTTLLRIADSLHAEALSPRAPAAHRDALVIARKLMAVLDGLAAGGTQPGDSSLGRWIDAFIVVMPRAAPAPDAAAPPPPAPPAPPPTPTPDPGDDRRKRLAALALAHRELSLLAADEQAVTLPPAIPVPPVTTRVTRAARPAARAAARSLAATLSPAAAGADVNTTVSSQPRLTFTARALNGLSGTSKQVLAEMKIDTARVHPTGVVGQVEGVMAELAEASESILPPNIVISLGGALLNKRRLQQSLGMVPGGGPPAPPPLHACGFEAGIGDLLLVRQTLKAYELGEFAHIENVMAGESRVREHRRLDVREQTEVTERETETEKERDLQSTDRNEMQAEAEKTVKTQLALEAGLQISGSYGPSVSFTSNLGTSFSTSTEESQRKAVSYTREVSEKTSERVRERVKTELRLRVLQQTEELNRHAVENAQQGARHVRGIYRWMNKVYDARILNYGQRMMYEFVLPEPAAFFLYAMIDNPPVDTEIIKPDPPTYHGVPLRPSHLTRGNYTDWVAQYQVRNVPAPPPQFQHVAHFDKQDKVEGGSIFGRADKLTVPAGYVAYAATVSGDFSFTKDEPRAFRVSLGKTNFELTGGWGTLHKPLDLRYQELAVGVHLFNAWSFFLGIDVHCTLTAEGLAKWQQAVYDAIMEAYQAQKADYDSRRTAQAIQLGVPILGRNPLENRRLERDELKKLALMVLTGSVTVEKPSMQTSAEPFMDLDKICDNGSWIRFFENAFEWNNLVYVFYPYFWGRHSRWLSCIHFTDPDPDFAAFLKAGAVRLQVPVRPGFEKAMAYFSQTQQIWEGNDPPLVGDDLYVPIVDEIAENLGRLDDGVPYPEGAEAWEVRVPTSLVVVQNLEEIPNIRDALTGNDINIS